MKSYNRSYKQNKRFLKENQFNEPDVSFIVIFLEILSQVRIYHWQSFGYAEHTALGNYYDTMSDLVDCFLESYQGNFGRVFVDCSKILIEDMKEYSIVNYIQDAGSWLRKFRSELETKDSYNTTELQNQLDEMIAATNKLKYLLTLN
jgi:hypothetical protein